MYCTCPVARRNLAEPGKQDFLPASNLCIPDPEGPGGTLRNPADPGGRSSHKHRNDANINHIL
eukprot:5438152-Alexandrium_andersonii.AAC.1